MDRGRKVGRKTDRKEVVFRNLFWQNGEGIARRLTYMIYFHDLSHLALRTMPMMRAM